MSIHLKGFAVCPSGLEAVLANELTQQPGFRSVQSGRGGVAFEASAQSIARANLWTRIPTRLLVEAGRGTIRKPDDIRRIATQIHWENWFTFRQTLRIDLTVGREPRLEAPLARNFATLLVKDGVCDRFRTARGERPSIDTAHPDIRIWAHLDQNDLTLYVDTSGEPLFKRGWRQAKGEAPLRENLAAALIAMTPWDCTSPIMDPFCGSGALIIEAMQRALNLPPGYSPHSPRSFAAEHFHAQSPMGQVNWQALRKEAAQAIEQAVQAVKKNLDQPGAGLAVPPMQGSDHDPRMVAIAKGNAERALPKSIADRIEWSVSAMEDCEPIAPSGTILTNPPYGKRLSPEEGNPEFERALAESLKRRFSGWQAWILSDNLKLESGMRLKAARRAPVFNGDIECRWFRFDMVSGSMRDKPAPLS